MNPEVSSAFRIDPDGESYLDPMLNSGPVSSLSVEETGGPRQVFLSSSFSLENRRREHL